jgi:hypothetical protein
MEDCPRVALRQGERLLYLRGSLVLIRPTWHSHSLRVSSVFFFLIPFAVETGGTNLSVLLSSTNPPSRLLLVVPVIA